MNNIRQVEQTDWPAVWSIIKFADQKGHRHIYEWGNCVPLNVTEQADNVIFFEYTIITNDKISFHCNWVTAKKINRVSPQYLAAG